MAILAAATAVNLDMMTALELANTAAGIAVSRVGTYPVGHTEMIDAWCGSNMMRTAYIPISWEEAKVRWMRGNPKEKLLFSQTDALISFIRDILLICSRRRHWGAFDYRS